jgi:L-cysteine desulfidase
MGTIGDSKQLKLADIRDHINDKDAELVKQKLDNLKKNSNSALSRTDRSL